MVTQAYRATTGFLRVKNIVISSTISALLSCHKRKPTCSFERQTIINVFFIRNSIMETVGSGPLKEILQEDFDRIFYKCLGF